MGELSVGKPVAFATGAPYPHEPGMEALVMDPGDIGQAHQPDEFLALERIKPTVATLEKLTGRFCRHPCQG